MSDVSDRMSDQQLRDWLRTVGDARGVERMVTLVEELLELRVERRRAEAVLVVLADLIEHRGLDVYDEAAWAIHRRLPSGWRAVVKAAKSREAVEHTTAGHATGEAKP